MVDRAPLENMKCVSVTVDGELVTGKVRSGFPRSVSWGVMVVV